ncbi:MULTISPECIES: aldolase/citrate lyase family protein [Ramlibacter]|uniref:2-dehydro-3-deoxyglucarate aldolase n=1 Tax=Ramlibacter pinisoli TaxID=2682844 RepID=A0A6N8IP41_9BURK|nr:MULTISPECIES: HpcH/HpaI aldolase/citrate lyase family protein [Ramlibacter]MBA2960666.1 HpcH/HpaI aldolase/citrate lyase family protein [Ramlibacter sp. CGMCC 1.13660]MVQ27996.1 2-dehydro-3-deoxyglucarate aldolase [Ramlibacter pinisoli]
MQTPVNPFKQALRERRVQIGLWQGLASPYASEICAGAGFDWLLIDGEHTPNDLNSTLQAAQIIAGYPGTHAIGRVAMGHGYVGQMLIKQYLDLGLQTLLVPMVDTAEQARELVRSMRYPPQGVRGMAGARASRWGRHPNYGKEANDQVCLLVQMETQQALDNLDAILAVDGVDGVFIGPADLSASLGHVGNAAHPEVLRTIEGAVARINQAGKAAGILSTDDAQSQRWIDLGVLFVAVGLDNSILVRGTAALVAKFKGRAAAPAPTPAPGANPYA